MLFKKKDGSYRSCANYRRFNPVTEQDAHPLPRVDELLDSLNDHQLFNILDLRSGCLQVSMQPEDREKTALSTPDGFYEFLRSPIEIELSVPLCSPSSQSDYSHSL